jgi:hypothetical protein
VLYGPGGFQHMRGAPAEQNLYKPLRDKKEAQRVWLASEEMAGISFPGSPGPDGADRTDRVERGWTERR